MENSFFFPFRLQQPAAVLAGFGFSTRVSLLSFSCCKLCCKPSCGDPNGIAHRCTIFKKLYMLYYAIFAARFNVSDFFSALMS